MSNIQYIKKREQCWATLCDTTILLKHHIEGKMKGKRDRSPTLSCLRLLYIFPNAQLRAIVRKHIAKSRFGFYKKKYCYILQTLTVHIGESLDCKNVI